MVMCFLEMQVVLKLDWPDCLVGICLLGQKSSELEDIKGGRERGGFYIIPENDRDIDS